MRSDKKLNPRFTGSQKWTFDRGPGGQMTNVIRNPDGSENVWTAFSHSGKERNRLFLNQGGRAFLNASAVSGADSVLDGRSWIIWDPNRDGRPDIAVVNANQRLLQIFENRLPGSNHFLAIRLIGAGDRISNRDAIGSRVTVTAGGEKWTRWLSCGEGFASQNSSTMLIGIGVHDHVDQVEVLWPSGKRSVSGGLEAGGLLEFTEKGGVTTGRYREGEVE